MIDYSRVELRTEMKALIDFFNKLEKRLQYPNCEGKSDEKLVLLATQRELILWGKI